MSALLMSPIFQRLIAMPKVGAPPSLHALTNNVHRAVATATVASSGLGGHSRRFYSANIRRINQTSLLASFVSNAYCINSSGGLNSVYMEQALTSSCAPSLNLSTVQIRKFQSVGQYHDVADQTLHYIQDGVEDFLDEHYDAGATDDDNDVDEDIPEVNYASGVLTIYLPPHGTYVINKQTPNQQIWWSSPMSGPRRYEYDEKRKRWVNSRVVDVSSAEDVGDVSYSEEDTLGGILNKEFKELFNHSLDLEA